MRFYKIECLGRFLSEFVADVSALTYNSSLDKGRILYDETTNMLYFGDDLNNQFTQIGAGLGSASIPANEIILFDKATSVAGYTLQTDIDDQTIFVSKGAGSAIGPGASSVGDWDQGTHVHTGPSHTHTGGAHSHSMSLAAHTHGITSVSGSAETPLSAITVVLSVAAATASGGGGGSTDSGGTVPTTSSGTGNTGAGGTVNTWRPRGRIFTRQQKV